MKLKAFIVLYIFLGNYGFAQFQHNVITDLIKPINMAAGNTTTVTLSDLFYAEEYDVEFIPNENFIISLDKNDSLLNITPANDFTGMDLISFKLADKIYELPVKLELKKKYLFKYKPVGEHKVVNLFGQFNGWDRENLPMEDNDGDGIYSISIPLDPGRYEYKFFIDGAELIDPENPVKVPNGLGDFNSVIVINKTAADKHYLHILDYNDNKNDVTYNFYYESIAEGLITTDNVIALLDNFKVNSEGIKIDGNIISISINKNDLKGNKQLRVAVSKDGKATYFQTVEMINGIPVSGENFNNWEDAIIYSIMIDRFYDGDTTNDKPVVHPDLYYQANYQGGDLQGIIDKIDKGYFDSLGINTLWVSPIVDNTNSAYQEYPPPHRYFTGYHGYWPISATDVEEHFGDMPLAKKFVKTAHEHDIKVLLDFVANHVHIEHPFWKEHRDWFGVLELPDGTKNLRLWDQYRLTTWFEPYMPSFDYIGSKEALDVMTDNAVWWLEETSADGFRHDAVKHVPNKFWRTLTRKLKTEIEIPTGKEIYQVGETFGSFELISSYVNNGQLSSQFNFNLFDVALPVFLYPDNSFELLDLQMQKTFSVYGVNHLMANVMDSHDKIRYMAYADGDIEINSNEAKEIGWTNPPTVDHPDSYKKLQLHLAYILSIPGVPVIYYGDEIGMTGAADPDNRRMMRFDNKVNGYEKDNLKQISNLINLRKEHPALRHGDFYTLLADDIFYVYIRSDMNERVLVILNKSSKEATVELNIPGVYKINTAESLSDEGNYEVTNDSLKIEMSGISWNMFILK